MHADYEKATELLEHVDWSDVLSSDMDTAAQMWEERFLNIMEQCMPTITVSPQSNLPWLSNDLRKIFRNAAFNRQNTLVSQTI